MEITTGAKSPSQRRYTPAQKEQAVRLVRQLRSELGTEQGAVARVARRLGYGIESVRNWVAQADIDSGRRGGLTTAEQWCPDHLSAPSGCVHTCTS